MPIESTGIRTIPPFQSSARYEHHRAMPQDAYDRNRILLEWAGEGKRVLEVGCSTGYMSRDLVQRGCQVTGIEVDRAAAERARAYLWRKCTVLDLNAPRLGCGTC